ncbi:probable serine/threonine-protein kinase PBL15 [Mangifera indica]|uniref:probable serine/threonine-protein kinase PBL15 n=1 Tax=Mangifera indica TaxID=29780 RepID=UPI001CFAEACB|nr:probable serine/threonine-protein kinase PBL15 [Mangifera indica]
MSKSIATIVGGATGALVLMAIFVGLVWFCKSQSKNSSNKNSETGSSDPSAFVEWNREAGPSSARDQPQFGPDGATHFTMAELGQATRHFSESSLIGHGSFGPIYKGLLRDTVVAIKRRPGPPRQEFVREVNYLSEIRHRNLVTLLGYCQEGGSQMLVFEYLPNGNMCNHLYDTGRESSTKLEFKQRLCIALGAAKGLCHLHSLRPPLLHKNFKMANVLVDENFIAKVADAGVSTLLEKIQEAAPSHMTDVNVFRDPELEEPGAFMETSDVYSFGVFLSELVTGHEASHIASLGSYEAIIEWVRSRLSLNDFVDGRLVGTFTTDGMRDLIRLTLQCMSSPGRKRPRMEKVMFELQRIHEKEMALTTVMGEGTATITLGSELFTSK